MFSGWVWRDFKFKLCRRVSSVISIFISRFPCWDLGGGLVDFSLIFVRYRLFNLEGRICRFWSSREGWEVIWNANRFSEVIIYFNKKFRNGKPPTNHSNINLIKISISSKLTWYLSNFHLTIPIYDLSLFFE
jgi:hypothetical protein